MSGACCSFCANGASCCVRAADGDYNVVCPARAIARDVSEKTDKPVFMYYFSHGPAASLECERKGSVGAFAFLYVDLRMALPRND